MAATYLAFDLGAESGRAVLGRFDGERVTLDEVHRFPNVPVRLPDGLHWDALRLFHDVKVGLTKGARLADGRLDSVGVDTWGVDFALLDRSGALVANPHHYRDDRTENVLPRVFARVPRDEIYRATGIQFLPFNTLGQLAAMEGSPLLDAAETLLMMPDLMNYWLTGVRASEVTIASTSQLLDVHTRDWAGDLMARLDIPRRLFSSLIQPASPLAPVLPAVAAECELPSRLPVIAVGAHDTASAVAAVPAESADVAFISSGTWSLVGVERREPAVTPEALQHNFTNEAGVGGTVRFLKNVAGLWLLQECRRTWARDGTAYSYDELVRLAEAVPPFAALVDPDHPEFLPPGDMPERIHRQCAATGQAPPESAGAFVRCALESLALKHRLVVERIEAVTARPIAAVHVVGGGVRNRLLCQLTADALQRPVLAGPVEATALGNVMAQALARGDVRSLAEIREVIRRSFDIQVYEQRGDGAEWSEAFAGFERLISG